MTMPTTPLSKIGLDARAAELKEKLLKGRGLGQNRASPAQSPAPVTPRPPVDAATPPAASASARPLSERVKPPGPTLMATPGPGPRPTASLPADADDIAALISSISGSANAGENADSNGSNASNRDPQQATPARRTEPAAERPALPQKPAPKLSIPKASSSAAQARQPKQSPRGPPPATEASKQKQPQSAVESPEEGEVASTLQRNPPPAKPTTTKVTAKTATATAATKAPTAPATTKPSTATATPKAPSAPATPKIPKAPTPKASEKKDPVIPAASSANGPKATASDPITHRESPREKTGPVPPTQPPPRKLSSSSGNNSGAQPLAATTPKPDTAKVSAGIARSGAGQAVAIKKEPAPSEPVLAEPASSEDALNRLLSQVPDLKDFLEMTDYFNTETRTKKLDRFRRVKALAAEKLRIEEEERKLMEEEELEMGYRSTVARITSALSGAAAGSETNSVLTTPATPTPPTIPPTPTPAAIPAEAAKPPAANPAKRGHDEEAPEPRPKVPRLDAPPPPRSAGADSKPRADGPRDREMRDSYDSHARDNRDTRDLSPHRRPYPPSSPRYDDRYRRSPPPRPQPRRDYDDYDHRPKYNSYRNSSPERYRDSGSGYRAPYPVHIDLGRKGGKSLHV